MSAHSKLDKICVAIVVCCLILTALFINGESLGITKIVDEDAEQNSDSEYFTANDQDGNWDTSDAVVITLTGDGAEISGNGAYANDGNVVITNAGYYVVSGSLTDGYLSVDAYDSSKVFILLNGVEINCSDDACIRVEQADKVFLTLAEGSQNTLTSGSSYSDQALKDGTDGAVFAHDDLTINGSGSLTVNAEYRHGIAANDDLVITGGTITVTAAADAVHAKDSIRIKEASITVDAGDDGMVTSNEEENGYLYIESGSLNIKAADDGIHTTGQITITGGDITVSAGDDGIHSDTSVSFLDGTLLIEECYEGIEALIIDVSGGEITIYPKDDGFNANGNSDSQIGAGGMGGHRQEAFTGDTAVPSDMESIDTTGGMQAPPDRGSMESDVGMSTSPDMSSADSADGMPSPPDMGSADSIGGMPTPPDMGSDMGAADSAGEMPASPSPDSSEENTGTQSSAAANDEETYINISGGTITIINEAGNDADGLDTNGDLIISGGTIYVSLPGSGSNNAVDYGSESGGVAKISGGTIIACGASSMAEAFDSSSAQASILYNTRTAAEAGTTLAVKDSDGNVLLSWEVPCSFSSALVSFPQLEKGSTYFVAIGDNTEEITLEETAGIYGDAQNSMSGGNMHRGGMHAGGGGRRENSSTNSTDTEAADPDMAGMSQDGSADTGTEQAAPDMSAMNQGGSADAGTGQMPSDTAQGEMAGGPMQVQQEQSQEEEDQADETQNAAEPLDAAAWGILGGCTVLLLAGIIIVTFYKRH